MKEKVLNKRCIKDSIIHMIGTIMILIVGIINPAHHFMSGILLGISAIALYLVYVFFVTDRNWLDIRAVFTGVWLGTLALAALRLTDYQEQWLFKSWVLLAISYLAFQLGASLGKENGAKVYKKSRDVLKKVKTGPFVFSVKENRLFAICIGVTLIGLTCFIINIAIKGFVPAFSDSMSAYVDFYTKFHVFSTAATAVSGLCYYVIHTQSLSIVKKSILWVCIFYLVILFPILTVSRGVFIVASVPLAVAIFYLHGKKLHVFILCICIIGGVYMMTSNLRGYTDEYLDMVFEPSDIVIGNEDELSTEGEMIEGNVTTFALSPKMSFLYSYLTVSHDNFNEAVQNSTQYTWGARQLGAFNVILNIEKWDEIVLEAENHVVRPHLPTVNMMGTFYYDFHEFGVIFCSFFWALVFGLVQGYYEKSGAIFSLLIHGFSMNAVALSFFSSWIESFELWMFCGLIMILSIVASVSIKKETKEV